MTSKSRSPKFYLLSIFVLMLFLHAYKTDIYTDENKIIESKVDSLLALMTLDEKIGQMTQVRHFADLGSDNEIATKFIGSVIHTQGPNP